MAQLVVLPPKKKGVEKQNVKVVVRSRPLSKQEVESNVKSILKYLSQKDILAKDRKFQFDRVFKPETSQIEVYQHVVAPMIPDVLSGYNCTVFAYGQTGSGKTYTMTGNKCDNLINWKEDNDSGIIPRAAAHVFELLPADTREKTVKVSYLELYNEEIRDLLCGDDDTPLKIYSMSSEMNRILSSSSSIYNDMKGSTLIQGLTEVIIHNSEEICKQLQRGNIKRQTAPTLMNHQSSRSHTVFTITIFTKEPTSTSTSEEVLKIGKMNFVDLAGSENIARSGCKEMRAVELANINRSLLTLGRVIHALADKSKRHVPYRDSKLTRILQDSLGGHTKTCIIATISAASYCADETLSTLEYACRARDIKNSPTVNEKLTQNQVLDNLFSTIRRLEADLDACRNAVGFYISKDSYNSMTEELESLRGDKVSYADVLKEKNKQIEQLEEIIKTKNMEYEMSKEKCQKSREILNKLEDDIKQKKINLKKERFVSQTYQQEAMQMQTEAQELLQTTEMLSKQTNILQRKLENQFHINQINERNAREAVAKVLQMLNELSEEKDNMNNLDDRMCTLCREDIGEFKSALEVPLMRLKEVVNKFDRTTIEDLPIKENVISVLKDFWYITRKQIFDLRMKCGNFNIRHQQFSIDHVAELPTNIKQVIDKFQKAVYDVVKQVGDLFVKEDLEIYSKIEHLETQILIRKQEEDEMYRKRVEKDGVILNQINSLKQLIKNRQSNRGEKLCTELVDLTDKSKRQVDGVVDNFVDAYKELNATTPPYETLDKIVEDTENFGEQLKKEAHELEQLHISNTNETLDRLQTIITTDVDGMMTCINSSCESLDWHISALAENRQADNRTLGNFINNTTEILAEEFLNNVVSTKHEGDTPARQPELKPPALGSSLAPREVLLQKFNVLPELEDEDKENLPGALNMSTDSFESYRTTSSDLGIEELEESTNKIGD